MDYNGYFNQGDDDIIGPLNLQEVEVPVQKKPRIEKGGKAIVVSRPCNWQEAEVPVKKKARTEKGEKIIVVPRPCSSELVSQVFLCTSDYFCVLVIFCDMLCFFVIFSL